MIKTREKKGIQGEWVTWAARARLTASFTWSGDMAVATPNLAPVAGS